MGLIVPQTVRIRTNGMTCKHYREKGYEFEKCGDIIEVDVFDLPKGSGTKVKIICDVCGKEAEICYGKFVGYNEENKLITCGDKICKRKKYENTCMEKYGVKNVIQAEEVKEKVKQTNLERYGSESPFGSKEIQDKIKDTNLERYKCEYPLQSEEIRNKGIQTLKEKYGEDITNVFQVTEVKEKIKQTNFKNWGAENPMQNEDIKNKVKDTNLERYGSKNPFGSKEIQKKIKETLMKKYKIEYILQNKEFLDKVYSTNLERYGSKSYFSSDDFKNKIRNIWSFNGHEGPCSRQQKYIANLINGEINVVIAGYWADIYMEKENIVIEYDGSGHFLGDKMNGNAFPTKESLLHEKEREDKIINNGYRMIRFIATKDRIPSDEVILNLIEGFKNFDFKVIRINFEEGTIDRDYEEKSYRNFDKLRKITKADLEQFEKQGENTSKN